jgi:hypothetical protein
MRLRDRADLIALVAKKTPSRVCQRACVTGRVEVLGGFAEIPPGDKAGWIVRLTAKHGSVFHVAVIPDDITHEYRVRLIEGIPWHLWMGTPLAGAAYSVYQGDHPATYDARRDAARELLERGRQKVGVFYE